VFLDELTRNQYDLTNMAELPRRLRSGDYFTESGLPLRVDRHRLTVREIGEHSHDFTELIVIFGGRGVHLAGGQTYSLSAGDVFVITGQGRHAYRDLEGLELVNILFRPERMLPQTEFLKRIPGFHALFVLEPRYRRRPGFRGHLHLDAEALSGVAQLVARIEQELRLRAVGYEALAAALLAELVAYLSRGYARERARRPRNMWRMAETISHVEAHYREPLPLHDLAARAHMSVNTLLRAFKDATGRSPRDYQLRLRVLKAAELLREQGVSVTEAAYSVGFSDSNYFTKQFRRRMGLTPRAFRRQARLGR
jgi:AraC-like DNA-binding protein